MKLLHFCSVIGLLHHAVAVTLTSNLNTTYGPVFGTGPDSSGIIAFKSIPYAAPPVGDGRWQSPRPPMRWTQPLNATAFGPRCYNYLENGPPTGPQSEDCLTVNVWTGASNTTECRPVMVFIHGGGFEFGASSEPVYNGQKFAEEGVVLVSFNYRLGNLGFLALPQLDQEGHNSGNFGLQDQILALRWVRENIAAFGGNPSNILVFGESAGAHSIGILMASPLAHGAFDKAILESGAWWDSEHGSITTFDQARAIGTAWTEHVGVTSLSGLRALPAPAVVNQSLYSIAVDPALKLFAPSIDNFVLHAAPSAVFHAGQQAKVPLIAGWNGAEELLFLPRALPHNTAGEFISSLPLLFGARTQQALSQADLYPANSAAQANASAAALIGDLVIREQTWEAADTQRSVSNSVFAYYFTYRSTFSPVPAHTAELPFVFGSLVNDAVIGSKTPANAADQAFSKQIMKYWVNFARSANPNGPGLPTWPAYTGSGNMDILGLNNSIAPVTYDLHRFKFIEGFRSGGVLPESWRSINVSEATG